MARDDEEWEELRRRAYGRGADIHLDTQALERLRELEEERSPTPLPEPDEPAPSPPDVIEELRPTEIGAPRPSNEWMRRRLSVRRSTVLIALAVVAFIVVIVVVLTVVQRVQTDPLQTGASQVARLAPDPGYPIPAIFGGSGTSFNLGAKAYEEFHHLRVVVTSADLIQASKTKTVCVNVFQQTDITDPTSTSFSGQFFSGCAAGSFPAMAQFDLRTDGLPKGLRSSLSPWTALQFVYDGADDEVVVFASK